ncbi:MAG: TIGR02584 family CRISPR-associated protein [Candidatus Latescibacteria bacterium]|nr:TIGR02584 family CRISPR-associated protein [Candidatus Latescibacterota bacterium]
MKNILLAVIGLSPQVITETLFALHQQRRRIDAIHVITTRKGKEAINAILLAPNGGQYYRYCADYGIDPRSIDFGFDHVHVIADKYGIERDDITDEGDNEVLLRKCLELTFKFTKDTNTAVFFSVAGGRKTMTSCLTLAAQLYGRPQDRIYHVLVSPEFESNRDFYYPPPKSIPIELKDAKGHPYIKETKYAAINLIHIPFVSIRDKLAEDMLDKPKDPATLMLSLIREEPYRLTVDILSSKITYKNLEIDMMPARLALYALFAMQKKDCTKEAASCRNCTDCYMDIHDIYKQQDRLIELYSRISGSREPMEMSNSGICGITPENFNSYKSKIKEDLRKGFGLYALPELEIESVGKRPDTRYGLRMERDSIRMTF